MRAHEIIQEQADTGRVVVRRIDSIDDIPRDADDSIRYMRRSRGSDSPHSGVDYAMFVEVPTGPGAAIGMADHLQSYGLHIWVSDGIGAVDVNDLIPEFARALQDAGVEQEYDGWSAADIAETANPDNIIDSAGLWDSSDLVEIVWNEVLERRGIYALKTWDGLIVFS
jgi:hypothetical protein